MHRHIRTKLARGADALVSARMKITLKALLFRIIGVFYVGRQVICPCCGGQFRRFLTGGSDTPRKNARCPGCGSLERHRLLWLYLINRTTVWSQKITLLHVAPERVLQRLFRGVPTIKYVSGDLDSPLAMLSMDLTSIPFRAAAFDVVLCNHVLEHVLDDRKAMRELLRVLKPGGWAILQVPIKCERTFEDPTVTTPEERLKVFGQRDHVRIYGRDFEERLASAGFQVTVERYAGEFDQASVNRYGLMLDDDIYLCTKNRGS